MKYEIIVATAAPMIENGGIKTILRIIFDAKAMPDDIIKYFILFSK
jgi:hypothetical protein